jgi:hypothetical protein
MIDRHGLVDSPEFRSALCHRVWRNNFRDTLRVMNVFRNTNLISAGKVLHPCRDIHCLAEVIEPLVERDCD